MRWAFRVLELLAKRSEGRRVLIVAVDVAQEADQLFESRGIEATMFLQAVFCASAKLIKIPSGLGDADDGNIEVSSLHHRLQGRKNLFVGEIAGGAEKNECVRVELVMNISPLGSLDFSSGFSRCPPNS